jgi:2-methylisocitrate lyase-like PEP mutase family enzyme
MVAAVGITLTADVEAGYGDPVGTTREVYAAGAVGMNLEDMVDRQLLPLEEQLGKIRAVKASGLPLVLNPRTDIFLAKHGDESTRFDRAVERLNAFHEAGADCLFAPGVADAETIGRLVGAVIRTTEHTRDHRNAPDSRVEAPRCEACQSRVGNPTRHAGSIAAFCASRIGLHDRHYGQCA